MFSGSSWQSALKMLLEMMRAFLQLIHTCGSVLPPGVLAGVMPVEVSITFMSGALSCSFFIQVCSKPMLPTFR
ncbi:Uncharacterised protein [Segatella copri]|nr:Uncharacterised protein [Segatella copri]